MNKKYLFPLSAALMLPSAAFAVEDIVVSGTIEVEAGFVSDFEETDSSDITLATVELGVDARITERVSGHVLLLHEEDDTALEVDEGTITVEFGNGGYLTAGQMYLPFGSYDTHMVSDPLTLEVGETRETALLLGFEADAFTAAAYAFNGTAITGDPTTTPATTDEESIEHFGLSLGYRMASDTFALNVGIDYLSNVLDSDALQETAPVVEDYASGMAVHVTVSSGPFSAIAEHVRTGEIEEITFDGDAATITASNIELGYSQDWGTVAVAYQMTEEAVALGLPKTSILLGYSTDIDENTSLGIEYGMHEDYDDAEGGTGNDGSSLVFQLAVSF